MWCGHHSPDPAPWPIEAPAPFHSIAVGVQCSAAVCSLAARFLALPLPDYYSYPYYTILLVLQCGRQKKKKELDPW